MASTNKIVFVTSTSISDRYNVLANADLFDEDNNLCLYFHPSDYQAEPFLPQTIHPGVNAVYTTIDSSLYQFQIVTENKKSREAIEQILTELFDDGQSVVIHDYHKMTDRTVTKMRENSDRGYAIRTCQKNTIEPVGGTAFSESYGLLGLGLRASFTQVDYD